MNALINLPYVADGDTVVTQTNACLTYLVRPLTRQSNCHSHEIGLRAPVARLASERGTLDGWQGRALGLLGSTVRQVSCCEQVTMR